MESSDGGEIWFEVMLVLDNARDINKEYEYHEHMSYRLFPVILHEALIILYKYSWQMGLQVVLNGRFLRKKWLWFLVDSVLLYLSLLL